MWASVTWELISDAESGTHPDLMNQTCILTRPSGNPQPHECTHLLHPFLLFYKWESSQGSWRARRTQEKGVWWGKHRARPRCLRLAILSRWVSEPLSKLLFCYNVKEALPFYGAISSHNREIITFDSIPLHINPIPKGDHIQTLGWIILADRNFWKKRGYIQSMKLI